LAAEEAAQGLEAEKHAKVKALCSFLAFDNQLRMSLGRPGLRYLSVAPGSEASRSTPLDLASSYVASAQMLAQT
jgi:hypothetical protein